MRDTRVLMSSSLRKIAPSSRLTVSRFATTVTTATIAAVRNEIDALTRAVLLVSSTLRVGIGMFLGIEVPSEARATRAKHLERVRLRARAWTRDDVIAGYVSAVFATTSRDARVIRARRELVLRVSVGESHRPKIRSTQSEAVHVPPAPPAPPVFPECAVPAAPAVPNVVDQVPRMRFRI